MVDPTENIRRAMVAEINSQVELDDETSERSRLEAEHGKVWDTQELTKDFTVLGFAAPFVIVQEKATGKRGSLMFTHSPRFYFGWMPEG